MYTEEEALTKWCPFARTAWAMNASDDSAPICTANRGNTDNDCRCIASECMAWRWDVALNDVLLEDVRAVYKDMPDPQPPLKDTDIWAEFLASRQGYCGLAGQPE